MFSSHSLENTFEKSAPPPGPSWFTVEAWEAEPHCHRCPRHGEGHGSVSGRAGGHGEWAGAPARARRLHSVCGARQHQAGAAPSSGGEEPDRWLLTEEQVRRDAPRLYWGETALISCRRDYTQWTLYQVRIRTPPMCSSENAQTFWLVIPWKVLHNWWVSQQGK